MEYVNFEIAKKLKEMGFNKPCPTINEAFDWLYENKMFLENDFIHPELREGEVFLINVFTNEEFNLPNSCISTRLGDVAYTTNGKEIVENARPLFGLLKK